MRQKRAKMYKRAMAVYVQTFNFRTPFQVLVSNDILSAGAAQQLNLIKGLQTCTQDEIKPMITQCCMEALYAKGKEAQKVTNLAKTLERRRCNHREAIPPDQCLTDVIGPTNKHRYIVATQSTDLLTSLQSIPGVPIIHFNPRGVLVLSPLSIATERTKNTLEEGRRLEGNKILDGLDEGDNVVGAGSIGAGGSIALTAPPPGLGLGRRKVKGVNPLSMKKKKVMPPQDGAVKAKKGGEAGKRKRDVEEEDGEAAGDTRQDQEIDTGGVASMGGEDARKKKKKRKRKNKSEVAKVITELNATNRAGSEAEGDDSD